MRKSSLVLFAVGVCVVIHVHAPTALPVETDSGSVGNSAATDSSRPPRSTPKLHPVSVATTPAGRLDAGSANVGRVAARASKTVRLSDNVLDTSLNFPIQRNKLLPTIPQGAPQLAPNMLRPQQATFIENRGQFDERLKYQLGRVAERRG
jgi:hypothetical protein